MVRDKWEAIERDQGKEKPDSFTNRKPNVKEAADSLSGSDEQAGQAPDIAMPSIIAAHWSYIPELPQLDDTAILLDAKRRAEEEALLLVMAEA
jgi:hypothetical protein